jgi:hypothetical protein
VFGENGQGRTKSCLLLVSQRNFWVTLRRLEEALLQEILQAARHSADTELQNKFCEGQAVHVRTRTRREVVL